MLGHREPALDHYGRARDEQERLLADFPDEVDYRIDLAVTLLKMAYQLEYAGRRPDARAAQDRMVALVESLPPDHPRLGDFGTYVSQKLANAGRIREALPWLDRHIAQLESQARRLQGRPGAIQNRTRTALHTMYVARAILFDALGEHRPALANWERAIDVADEADRRELKLHRAAELAYLGEHGPATAAADAVVDEASSDGDLQFGAAQVYANAAAAAGNDAGLSTDDRAAKAERHAARAVELLNRSRAAGTFAKPGVVEQLNADHDWDGLRSRKDFKEFVAALEKPGP
jgi:tetratricopeptide (TPR) repeat protein